MCLCVCVYACVCLFAFTAYICGEGLKYMSEKRNNKTRY